VTTQLSLLYAVARENDGAQAALCRRLERQLMATYRRLTAAARAASLKKAEESPKQAGAARLQDLADSGLARVSHRGV
jgi:hypothetical protein